MSITDLEDGTLRFDYVLDFNPCSNCGCCSITLFEQGGAKFAREFKRGKTTGGGFCNSCGKRIERDDVEPVPSMTTLLNIWNEGN